MYVVTTYMSVTQMNKRVNANTSRIRPDPVIELYKKDIDRTLLRENLKLTVQKRFENLMALQRFTAELQSAGHRLRHPR